MEWISVNKMMPDKDGLYLTFNSSAPKIWLHLFDKSIGKFGAWMDYDQTGKYQKKFRFIEAECVTHWMPLPEPPHE